MSDTAEQDPPMSLIAHLTELRDRLLRAVLAIVVGFIVPFKLSLVLAIFLAIPVILFQIWGFIAPGLY